MVDSTPEEIADQMLAADPIDLLKTAAAVYDQASKREDRQNGVMLAVQSAIIYLERNTELNQQDLAPLQALAGALNDLKCGVPTELLERPVIGGRANQERSTFDDRKAAGVAAVDHLIKIGLSPTGHAEAKIGQVAGVTAKQVKHWRKLKRLKASLTYKATDKKLTDDPTAKIDMPDEIASPPKEPVVRAVVSDDTTTERLAQDMQDARGMVMVRDELPEWHKNLRRYSNGDDRPFYLTCYTGGSRQVRRKGNTPDIHVEDCFLGIVGGAQPDLAKDILDRVGGDDGLADRFGLIGWIDSSEVGDDLDEEPDETAERDILEIARRLYKADWNHFLENSELRFSADAVDVFTKWRHKMVARVRAATDRKSDPNQDTAIAGLLSKAPGLAVRLAGLVTV